LLAALLSLAPLLALATTASASSAASDSTAPSRAMALDPATGGRSGGLEALVPELAARPYHLAAGPREFQHRVSISPSFGNLGAGRLFAFRAAYNPNPWLGYEASIGHNPAHSVHAVLHTVSAIVRHPFPGRFQPFASGGYGMMMVFPGRSLNASQVTKNALVAGGGLEFYIRSDLALRADVQYATVFGRQKAREGVVTYDYLEETLGLSFYRTIRP